MNIGSKLFLINIKRASEKTIYMAAIKAIYSIEKPLSINSPKTAVPNAVEKTIKAVAVSYTHLRAHET